MEIAYTWKEKKEAKESEAIRGKRRKRKVTGLVAALAAAGLLTVASGHAYERGVEENAKLSRLYNGTTNAERQRLRDYGIEDPNNTSLWRNIVEGAEHYGADSAEYLRQKINQGLEAMGIGARVTGEVVENTKSDLTGKAGSIQD